MLTTHTEDASGAFHSAGLWLITVTPDGALGTGSNMFSVRAPPGTIELTFEVEAQHAVDPTFILMVEGPDCSRCINHEATGTQSHTITAEEYDLAGTWTGRVFGPRVGAGAYTWSATTTMVVGEAPEKEPVESHRPT